MFITLIGNVSSGKYRVSQSLKRLYGARCSVYNAPYAKWERTGIMDNFYQNYETLNGSLPYLITILNDYDQQFKKAFLYHRNHPTELVIMLGGVKTTVYCTAKLMLNKNLIDEEAFNILNNMYLESFEYNICRRDCFDFPTILSLKTPPLECRLRVISRNIDNEIKLFTRDTLTQLDELYYQNSDINILDFSEEELIKYIKHIYQ